VKSISRYRWLCTGVSVSLLAVSSIAVHPFGRPKQSGDQKSSLDSLTLTPEITALLKRSCMDCHSNETVWPWYSYVAPMSWLVERDVHRGRDHMNLSEWQQYSWKQQEKLLADIASAVKNAEMPLPQYTLVHRRARLSDAERDMVYQWARVERRKLRAVSRLLPSSAQTAGSESTLARPSHSSADR
jgi:hypothetical protein